MAWRLLRRAQTYHQLGAYRKAAALYQQASESDPTDAGILLWRGLALAECGRFEEARQLVAQATTLAAAPLFLARILYDAGETREAARALQPLLEHNQNQQAIALAALCRSDRSTLASNLPNAPWLLARVLLAVEQNAPATPPGATERIEIPARSEQAGWGMRRAGDRYVRQGLVHLRNGNWQSALAAFREACRLIPGDPRARYGLGTSLYYTDHLEQAHEWLQGTADGVEEPLRSDAQATLGKIAVERGELPEAVLLLRRAIAAGAAEPDNYYGLGLALLRTGHRVLARRAFEKCVTPQFVRQRLEETAACGPTASSGT